MAVCIGLADFLDGPFFPLGTFRDNHQSVVTKVIPLVLREKLRNAVEIEWIFRDQATRGGNIRGVERGEPSVAAEDAKMPMRSWEPSVVRWRVINSFARVTAVEKPMQYSVPWTSLSIVFGMAMTGMP